MVDVKQAVANALKFLVYMYGEQKVLSPRLEEVELSEDGNVWYVTVSFLTEATASELVEALSGSSRLDRQYKILTVWANDGNVRSMKIRQLV